VHAHWSGYLLLAVYAISQISSTYFMSTTMDKAQRTLMMILPLFFVFFLLNFPTGLLIYWVTTNLWTVGQGISTRRLVPRTPLPQVRGRSARTPPRDDPSNGDGDGPEPPAPKPPRPQQQRQVKRKKKGTGKR